MLASKNGKSVEDNLFDPAASLNIVAAAIGFLASGFYLLFHSPASMGCWALGWVTILSVWLVYPAFIMFGPPTDEMGARACVLLWFVMLVLLPLRSLINRRRGNKESPYEIGTPAFGWAGGTLLPLGAAAFIWGHCPGMACYIGGGWIARRMHVSMIRARFERQAKHASIAIKEAEMFEVFMQKHGHR